MAILLGAFPHLFLLALHPWLERNICKPHICGKYTYVISRFHVYVATERGLETLREAHLKLTASLSSVQTQTTINSFVTT